VLLEIEKVYNKMKYSYDIEYYSGNDLRKPQKPTIVRLAAKHNSADATSYAQKLEKYEIEILSYTSTLLPEYQKNIANLHSELKLEIMGDYKLTAKQFDLLWNSVYEFGSHCSNLEERLYLFDAYYKLVGAYNDLASPADF
jgi:hypothetical protein